MPFENVTTAPKRIAVIGAGISGLAAAHLLADRHNVTLLEAEPRLGGHARTVMAGRRGDQPVDTGFIVFNNTNYPNLVRMFDALDVPIAESNMSFGASLQGGRFEYAFNSIDAIFATRRNIADPRFLRMIRDILRFNRRASDVVQDPAMTIGGLIDTLRLGPWFRDRYLLPFSGAIWSTPTQDILDFPAQALVRFFENHALMGYNGQHQWFTVQGGSIEYVRRLESSLRSRGTTIRTGASVAAIRRTDSGAELRALGGEWESFDEIVMATHSDDSLAMLSDATPDERAALGAVRYQPNQAVLHSDPAMMPRRRKCWASWVYTEDSDKASPRIDLTYWMNSLQPIPKDDPLFVTLNTTRTIREDLIHDVTTFRHPVYDVAALRGQAAVRAMNGANRTWFCGAWMRNGFHEDGFASAVDVVEALERREPGLQGVA